MIKTTPAKLMVNNPDLEIRSKEDEEIKLNGELTWSRNKVNPIT